MRNASRIQIFVMLMGLAVFGCTGPTVDQRLIPNPAPRAGQVAPRASDQTIALQCTPPQRQCARCNGSGTFCANRCPECAPQLAPAPATAVGSGTCRFPLQDCSTCTGAHICARSCPLCPAPVTNEPEPAADTLALSPSSSSCG